MQLYIRHSAEWEPVGEGTEMLHIAGYVGMVTEPRNSALFDETEQKKTRWTVSGPGGLHETRIEYISLEAAKYRVQQTIYEHADEASKA